MIQGRLKHKDFSASVLRFDYLIDHCTRFNRADRFMESTKADIPGSLAMGEPRG